jgi:signal peptidase II
MREGRRAMTARSVLVALGVIALAAAADAVTKLLASLDLADAAEPLLPFLSLSLAFNRGVRFSMFPAGIVSEATILLILPPSDTARRTT